MVASTKSRSAAKGAAKTFSTFRKSKTGRKLETVVTSAMKKELEKKIKENPTVGGLAMLAINASRKFKSPIGAEGRSLNVLDTQLVDTTSAKSTTESASLYFYRPHRSSHPAETLDYVAKKNRVTQFGSSNNAIALCDVNGLVLEPIAGDATTGTERWTNISMRGCFDEALLNKNVASGTDQQKEALQLHVQTYSSTLQIKAESSGAIVDIYDLKPKFQLGPTTYVSSEGDKYATGYMSPHWCYATGMSETIEPMDAVGATTLGYKLTDSVLFKRSWDIIKRTTVRMTDSSIHRHRFVFGINKTVAYQEMAQASTAGGTAPWCPCQLVVVRGYTDGTNLAAATNIDLELETSLTYKAYPGDTSKVIVYDART